MAVMTSQLPEGVAFEEKTQPVPSSDKMALDIEINGAFNRDENINDTMSSEDLTLTQTNEFTSTSVGVNGASSANLEAFSFNQSTIPSSSIDLLPLESQATEVSTSAPVSSDHPNTNTITTSSDTTTPTTTEAAPELQNPHTSPLLNSADSAVDTAVDDITGSSTVPPIVDALESDLRDSSTASAPEVTIHPEQDQLPTPDILADKHYDNTAAEPENMFVGSSLEIEGEVEATSNSLESSPAVNLTSAETQPPADTPTHPQPASELLPLPLTNLSQTSNDLPPSATESSIPPESTMSLSNDFEMTDAPQVPLKVAREREDDEVHEPQANRPKTENEDDSLLMSAPEGELNALKSEPATPAQNGNSSGSGGTLITLHEPKELITALKNAARTQSGKAFKDPVATSFPLIAEAYAAKVSTPIDLTTMEGKLREGAYPTIADFKLDVELLASNSVAFNGYEHVVSKQGRDLRETLLGKINKIPPPPELKEKTISKRSTPRPDAQPRVSAPRRQSKGVVDSPSQTFALDPQTRTPLIRRDSTKVNGRPKREIHPPKNKDLPYMVRPKKKKFATELKFCEEALNELKKPKYSALAHPFIIPVDPVALSIPHYHSVITSPMDLQTVTEKLALGRYSNSKEFAKDIKLMFSNCYKFNPIGNNVRSQGQQLESVFDDFWAKKDKWISDHAPAAASPAVSALESEDEEESESEDVQPDPTSGGVASARLIEEQKKLIELMSAKPINLNVIAMQQDMVKIAQAHVEKEKTAQVPSAKKAKKPKTQKPPRKAAPAKKAALSSRKSGGGNRQPKYLGTLEKEVISEGLGTLPDEYLTSIMDMIKKDRPDVDVGDDGTLELDIESITVPTLWRIYNIIAQHNPQVEIDIRKQLQERDAPRAPAKPAQKKKNKPMSKTEQERKIELLKSRVEEFERHGSGSQEPILPTVEKQDESSGDEDSDSEEE